MDAFTKRSGIAPGEGAHFIAAPGILNRPIELMRPLMPVLVTRHMMVTGLHYSGTRFDPNTCVEVLKGIVTHSLTIEHRTVLFGSSLGGMLVTKALGQLHEQYSVNVLNKYVSTIIVDSPSGGNDMAMIPVPLTPTAKLVTRCFTPPQSLNDGLGKVALDKMTEPPKDDEIDESLDKRRVKEDAKALLSGHLFTVWYDQLSWMLNSRLNLDRLNGLDITYLACTKGNVTVRQPQALETWRPHVRQIIEVETPHCAYLQAQPTWRKVLGETLDGLGITAA